MEFGPRALGGRSILADPRNPQMQALINLKIKFREGFRPFAPSVLQERSAEYFDLNSESPYMLIVAPVREDRRLPLPEHSGDLFGRPYEDPFMITVMHVLEERQRTVPAVVHVDGTARPQTVSQGTNPRYWRLIREFQRRTGVPMLLNTSFNVQEPIVCNPDDAIRTFKAADFDALVLEDHLVLRS